MDLNAPDQITLRWTSEMTLTLGRHDIPDAIALIAKQGGEDPGTAVGELARTMARFALYAEGNLRPAPGGET